MKTPRIIRSTHPRYEWEVVAPTSLFGRRIRRRFVAKAAAQVYLTTLQNQCSRNAVTPVTREEQVLLTQYRPTLTFVDMARAFAAEVERKKLGSRPLAECLSEFGADMAARHVAGEISALHARDTRRHLRTFLGAMPSGVAVTDILPATLTAWLAALPLAPRSKWNLLRAVGAFFNHAVRSDWIPVSPMAKVRLPALRRAAPCILTPEDMASLLAHADVLTRRWLVFGGFMGLRTSEIDRLRWEDVRLAEGHLYVSAGKTANAERWVSLTPPVLRMWKALLPERRGSVMNNLEGTPLHRRRQRTFAKAGVAPEVNALRHSYGSHHLVEHSNPSRTAMEMGHHSPQVTFACYRRAVTRTQAAAWWAL